VDAEQDEQRDEQPMAADTNTEKTQTRTQTGDASAKLNEDLYRWSPEGPAGQGKGGCHTKENTCGDAPKTGGTTAGSGDNKAICDWRPDPTLSTPRARAWQAESEKRRHLPMEVNADCTYTVKWGDSLETVAERELRREGIINPSARQINAEVTAFVKANHGQYKTLDCNRDFIREGWKLHIPKCEEKAPVVEKPCPPPVQEKPCPPPVQEKPCPPPVQERPCPPPVVEVPVPAPQDFRPPAWFRPEPVRECPPVYEQPCPPPAIICRPAQMQIIRIPEPVCYPVQIPSNCCCCCRPCQPMYGPPQTYAPQPPRYYYEEPQYQPPPRYYEPPRQYYQPAMPDATYRAMPEPGYRPRPYANYPFEPLIPSNDWVHRR
jgi:hypothetical protein